MLAERSPVVLAPQEYPFSFHPTDKAISGLFVYYSTKIVWLALTLLVVSSKLLHSFTYYLYMIKLLYIYATLNCRNRYGRLFPEFGGFAVKDKLLPSSSQKCNKHKKFPGMHLKYRLCF